MRVKTIGVSFFLIFFLAGFTWGQQKEAPLNLSLEDCILKALKNNLTIAIEVLGPETASLSVSRSKEKFMPTLSFDFTKRSTNSASYSWLEAAETTITDNDAYTARISQLIPTGGSLSVTLDTSRTDTNSKFQTINPRYGSTLRFSFTQPILKDFGIKTSTKDIIIAQNNLDISENQFQKTLMDTIYTVEEAYWNLVYNIETLKVRQQSLKLARDLLSKNQRAVEVGTMAPIEILSAQAEVATREADILQAEAMVKNSEDRLKMILNMTREEDKAATAILPLDKPQFEAREMDLEQALLAALENRPDLQSTRIDIENQEINVAYAKNQLLPSLSLTASYWSPGVSGDQVLYLNNNPLSGVIVGTIPGGSSGSLKDTFNFKYSNWSVGINLDIPMSSFFSRANYAQAKVSLEQAALRLKNQQQQVFLEIKNAVRAVDTDYKRVQAYTTARELAGKKLEAEEEKLKVGLSTNFIVLQYQRELSNARSNELKAIIDYNLSLASLQRSMGVTLKNKNITIADFLGSL